MRNSKQCEGSVLVERSYETGDHYEQCEELAYSWAVNDGKAVWLCQSHFEDDSTRRSLGLIVSNGGPEAPF